MIKARKIAYTGMIVAALSLSACSNMSNRDQRMLSGAGIGAGTGAAIGAAAGTAGGYIYDRQKDD